MTFPYRTNRREHGARWGRLSAAAWTPQEPDYETLRRRALHDRRGTVLREGVTFHGDGRETRWCVRHAIAGRTDQFELVANGRVFARAGPRNMPKGFKP